MPPDVPGPVSVTEALASLGFMEGRTPDTPDDGSSDAFAELARYRDGGIFLAHYAGDSPWERHPRGDEIVAVIAGSTTIFMLVDGVERAQALDAGELVIVPQGVWHRFESPGPVKVMTVTPQPTDHSVERPG